MKHLNNNKGSTITTAVIVLLIVMILTGGFYMLAGAYYRNTINEYSERQAYLYAKGECTVLGNYLVSYGKTSSNPYWVPTVGDTKHLINIEIHKVDANGNDTGEKISRIQSSSGTITRESEDKMVFKVTVKVGGESSTVTLTCQQNNNNWEIGTYK